MCSKKKVPDQTVATILLHQAAVQRIRGLMNFVYFTKIAATTWYINKIIPVSIALLGISSVFYEDLGHSFVALTMDYLYTWREDLLHIPYFRKQFLKLLFVEFKNCRKFKQLPQIVSKTIFFLNLKTVGNSNSCHKFQFFT